MYVWGLGLKGVKSGVQGLRFGFYSGLRVQGFRVYALRSLLRGSRFQL